jgi:hypothetical protein
MKRFKLLCMSALAVSALTFAAVPVSSASAAAKKVLQLDEGETAASKEAPAVIAFGLHTCIVRASGHLTGNDAATVKLAASETSFNCDVGQTEGSGSITEATMTATKKLTLKGSITISEVVEGGGLCTYTFNKFTSTFKIPGRVEGSVKAAGKLAKGSAKSCAKTLKETITVAIAHHIGETESLEAFNAALVAEP